MSLKLSKISTLLGFSTIIALSACVQSASETPNTGGPGERKTQLKAPKNNEVLRLIANRSCSSDADCKVIEFGARACGGPSQLLTYSAANVLESDLQSAAERFSAEEKDYLEQSDAVGTCEAFLPPFVGCRQSLCAILQSEGGEPSDSEVIIVQFQNESVAAQALSELQSLLPTLSSRKIFANPPMYSFKLNPGIDADNYIPLIREIQGVLSVEQEKTVASPDAR